MPARRWQFAVSENDRFLLNELVRLDHGRNRTAAFKNAIAWLASSNGRTELLSYLRLSGVTDLRQGCQEAKRGRGASMRMIHAGTASPEDYTNVLESFTKWTVRMHEINFRFLEQIKDYYSLSSMADAARMALRGFHAVVMEKEREEN